VHQVDTLVRRGRIVEAYGSRIRVSGLDMAVGELCKLDDGRGRVLHAEVVGLSGDHLLLAPLGPIEGLSVNAQVMPLKGSDQIPVGEALLGRVIDAFGEPRDDRDRPVCQDFTPLYASAPEAMTRLPVDQTLPTGVRAIDGLLTAGLGQRVGIFAAAGGGKSTLLGMLVRGTAADVIVIVLVGERGREVREFIDDSLGEAGLARSVLVVATADRPALERCRAAYVGTAIAEYFRDRGLRVLLLMDSVTRFARALRDVGLATGEPPTRRGFTPSVFANLPRLFERAGNSQFGYMTAFYTVLLEDENQGEDPVGEEVRSLLDGHIVLSRQLAASAHFPAIDVLVSASRVMNRVTGKTHLQHAGRFRSRLARFQEVEALLQMGEYRGGADPETDRAVASMGPMRAFLQQGVDEISPFDQTLQALQSVVSS
jgi:type III secretion protein N (ATPase)